MASLADNMYSSTQGFIFDEASYYALTGDQEEAMNRLEQAADLNATAIFLLKGLLPEFEPLHGLPRYEATKSRMMENLNRERAHLGLDPFVI